MLPIPKSIEDKMIERMEHADAEHGVFVDRAHFIGALLEEFNEVQYDAVQNMDIVPEVLDMVVVGLRYLLQRHDAVRSDKYVNKKG